MEQIKVSDEELEFLGKRISPQFWSYEGFIWKINRVDPIQNVVYMTKIKEA